jgi:ferredoxin
MFNDVTVIHKRMLHRVIERNQKLVLDENQVFPTRQMGGGGPADTAKKAIELHSRGVKPGDCVACNMCVNVCPIGIDIREGPNFFCINCGSATESEFKAVDG